MTASEVPEKYRDLFVNVLDGTYASHILWMCKEGITVSIGKKILPDNVSDPLDYIRENNILSDTSKDTFNVFAAKIEDGILSGTDHEYVSADVELKFPGSDEYALYHCFALFMCDGEKRVSTVFISIRPFNTIQVFNKQILSEFTSDKAPKILSAYIREFYDMHPDEEIAFIQLDIERFKMINERSGVEIGDELLKFINDCLSIICGDKMPFCRLTADVFMVVMTFKKKEEIVSFIRHIESMIVGYKGLEYRLVFGIYIVEDRSMHTRRCGDNAALARQKMHGNALENIGWYNGTLKIELEKMQSIESDMYKALVKDEFLMYLQPKYSISTNRIIGAEALARWNHTKKGMISPADFIPVFEKNGFILKLDRLIWEKACIQIREWLDKGIEAVPISVNISREYIKSFDVVGYISGLVKKYNIPIKLLELEITESVDSFGVDEIVGNMKQAGFTMLMDDFGSGYSSLNMLKTTQFDVLKIDRGFLNEFMGSDRGRKIISHTISMSHDIGIDIIAEGVETLEQANFLEKCGCDMAQGFYYSKPIPADEFSQRLISTNK